MLYSLIYFYKVSLDFQDPIIYIFNDWHTQINTNMYITHTAHKANT